MKQEERQPCRKFIAGSVQAAVWRNRRSRNDGTEYVDHSVSVDKRYKDRNDEWQSTNSFRAADIPKAVLVLNQAYEFIVMKAAGDSEGQQGGQQ